MKVPVIKTCIVLSTTQFSLWILPEIKGSVKDVAFDWCKVGWEKC